MHGPDGHPFAARTSFTFARYSPSRRVLVLMACGVSSIVRNHRWQRLGWIQWSSGHPLRPAAGTVHRGLHHPTATPHRPCPPVDLKAPSVKSDGSDHQGIPRMGCGGQPRHPLCSVGGQLAAKCSEFKWSPSTSATTSRIQKIHSLQTANAALGMQT